MKITLKILLLFVILIGMSSAILLSGEDKKTTREAEDVSGTEMQAEHEKYIAQCYELARSAEKHGNHPFGALLVKDGEVIMTAENTVWTGKDVTRHAELNLVSMATQKLDPEILSQCTLYTSTEPCIMCCGAIFWARIPRIVYGVDAQSLADITGGNYVITSREVFSRMEPHIGVTGPVNEAEGMAMHQAFWPELIKKWREEK